MTLRQAGSFKSIHVAAARDLMKWCSDTDPSERTIECDNYRAALMDLAGHDLEELVLPLFLDPIILFKVALNINVPLCSYPTLILCIPIDASWMQQAYTGQELAGSRSEGCCGIAGVATSYYAAAPVAWSYPP